MLVDDTPAWAEKYRPSAGAHFFDGDELTEKTSWWIDNGDGKIKILTVAPVDEMLDVNAELRALNANQKWGDGMQLVARIPEHVFQRQLAEAIKQEDKAYLSRWLNNPDHAYFRTKEGKV